MVRMHRSPRNARVAEKLNTPVQPGNFKNLPEGSGFRNGYALFCSLAERNLQMTRSGARCLAMLKTLFVSALLVASEASPNQTENHELRALPAPEAVDVDGSLDEWDLSGEILICPDVVKELDRHAVRAAALYDAEYLYLGFRFTDDTPMVNAVNPESDPGGGWRSDGVELRMLVDDRSIHIHPWYYTEGKRPSMHIRYAPGTNIRGTKDQWTYIREALDKGALLRFRRHEDGKGYAQEMAIPWTLLTTDGRALKAGEAMKLGIQVNWGDASGGIATGMPQRRYADLVNPEHPQRDFFWDSVKSWGSLVFLAEGQVEPSPSTKLPDLAKRLQATLYSTAGPVAVAYELPEDGFVTLVIEKPDGTRVRNFISDWPRRKGKNIDYWDGTDDDGALVPPGEYRVRGLFHQKLDVLYRFHFGNPMPTPWATMDGKGGWLSNHCNHFGVAADEERVYVSAPSSEGPYPLIALDDEGNQVWGALARWHAGPMARCGEYLYTVNDHAAGPARNAEDLAKDSAIELIRLDPKTGREVLFPDRKSRHTIAHWNVQAKGAAKKWEGWTVEHAAHNADWVGINPQGLAALDGTLYVSLHFDDKLLKVDAESGTVTGEIPVPDPAGVVAAGDHLLVISGTSVVRLAPETGQSTPIVTKGLKAPVGLARDEGGNLYVSDWADQMCVKVFSPEGALQKHIGTVGGRPWQGQYDAAGMLLPLGVAIDGKGRLWVAENDASPRRVSCWDTATGRLAIERIGRGRYGGMGYYVLPDRPEQGIYNNCLVGLDWEKRRWRVESTLWRGTRASEILGFDPYTRFGRVIHREGRRLVVHTSFKPQGGITIISELTPEGRARPLAAAGHVVSATPRPDQQHQGAVQPPLLLAQHLWSAPEVNAGARRSVPWYFAGPRAGDRRAIYRNLQILHAARQAGWKPQGTPQTPNPNGNLVWSDLDRDGAVDEEEIQFHATPGLPGPLPVHWAPESWSGGVVDDALTFYLTAVQGDKAYHYRLPATRWSKTGVPVYDPAQAETIVASPYMGQAAWLSREGHLLTLANIPNKLAEDGRRDPLVMYRSDGSIAWTFPSPWTGVHGSHTAPKQKRGLFIGPLGVFGEGEVEGVGEILAFHTNVGTAEFFTADGLYLGRIFQDTRSAPDPWPEPPRPGQSLNRMTPGGEWFGGQFFQRPDGRMFVLCSRSAGVVAEVTGLDSTRRLETQALRFTEEAYVKAQAQLAAARTDEEAEKVMPVASLHVKQGPPPRRAFRWDEPHAASWNYGHDRSARASWGYDEKNLHVAFEVQDRTPLVNSGEDVRRLFKFGDAAILELRTDPTQTGKQAAVGDMRLLFSVHQGKPVAVLYDYRRPGAKDPVEFTSVKTTRIDRLVVIEEAQIAIDRTPEGYTLRACVPLSAFAGWTPEAGVAYPGDFGIVYSDKTGQSNELRMYWSNKATGIVSDLSLEADIQPALWGRFEVEEK